MTASNQDLTTMLMARLSALEGEIAMLKGGAGFVPTDVCTQLAGWIQGGGGGGMVDIRYDATTKQFQKKTVSNPTWTMIEGGQAETCP